MRFLRLSRLLLLAACAASVGIAYPAALLAKDVTEMKYPPTRTVDVVDEQFGEAIADPYRWLENDVREDAEVAQWVESQNALTNSYLAKVPGREALAASMAQLYDYDNLGVPIKAGERYFYERKSGGQNQALLYVRDSATGTERVLIDPATWSSDGATALAEWQPSADGSLLVYAIQDGGSDWRTLRVIDVASGAVLEDKVEWAKFTNLAWMPNNKAFLYSRFPAPAEGTAFQSLNENHAVYNHVIGQAQSQDIKVYATADRPELTHAAELTSDKRWVVVSSSAGTDDLAEVTLIKVDAPTLKLRPLIKGFDHSWHLIDGIGDKLYFITDKDAARKQVMVADISQAGVVWQPVVPQAASTIDSASLLGDQLLIHYLDSAASRLTVYQLDGSRIGDLQLPGVGTISSIYSSAVSDQALLGFSSFNRPQTIFAYDGRSPLTTWAAPELPFDPATIAVSQVYYSSKDGTKVPMFLVHRKDHDLKQGAPTLLYGYGGFDVSILPKYQPAWLAWVEAGGVFASANLRGGGEFGREWHDGGRLQNKQNVFDDFIAAGEYLLAEGITSPGGLAIEGRSNGGLLIGAVMNQRPDLFNAGHAAVGVMDMLRFDRFTAGRYWVDDYGYPDREADFRVLRAYSPYHNIKDGVDYPALMVSTADTDDRVVPGHSFKYIARMQALKTGSEPHLIRIESRAGHGSGKPTDKTIAEYSDIYAFLAEATGLKIEE